MGQSGGTLSSPPPSASIPVPLRPQELGSEAGFQGLASTFGADPQRQKGEEAKSGVGNLGTPTSQRLGFSASASRRCSARNERHLLATGGRCVRFLRKSLRAFYFSRGPGGGGGGAHQYTIQPTPTK